MRRSQTALMAHQRSIFSGFDMSTNSETFMANKSKHHVLDDVQMFCLRQGRLVSWDASQGERIKIKTSNRCANPETGSVILIHGCFLSGWINGKTCFET
ncbi:hypothetical protein G5714_003886 [Onychostoma macrolepis]|uniref:Uncharacterized protein n=1 Tax=Onychostoma macrolepis TaxID=369639 RepID=A0A7J6DAQ5_9TELE|nr:hypothetical protein G5714_003886 [Onychostoma macrolepis]